MNKKKITAITFSILGIIIVVDNFLAEFFNIGVKQDSLVAGYCITFVLISIKFPDILKSKLVIIPMYIIVLQTLYSLVITYI